MQGSQALSRDEMHKGANFAHGERGSWASHGNLAPPMSHRWSPGFSCKISGECRSN